MTARSGSLDANVLLRWLLDDVPAQTKAIDALLAKGGGFRVSDMALFELVYVLERVYDYAREDIGLNMNLLQSNAQLLFNRVLFDRAMQAYLRYSKLSFADCYLVTEGELAQAGPLYTFDRKLASQATGAKLVRAGK
jgi:predicted nucleic-acid-binding protein